MRSEFRQRLIALKIVNTSPFHNNFHFNRLAFRQSNLPLMWSSSETLYSPSRTGRDAVKRHPPGYPPRHCGSEILTRPHSSCARKRSAEIPLDCGNCRMSCCPLSGIGGAGRQGEGSGAGGSRKTRITAGSPEFAGIAEITRRDEMPVVPDRERAGG